MQKLLKVLLTVIVAGLFRVELYAQDCISCENSSSIIIGSTQTLSNPNNGIALGLNSTIPTLRITKALNYNRTGSVVIGNVSSPQAKLHIHSDTSVNADIMLSTTSPNNRAIIKFKNDNNQIHVGSDNIMKFDATSYSFTTGKVGIGCVNNMNDFALAVQGGVICAKMSVLDIDSWPDFVFGNNYKLMNLYELEQYINTNQHLPEVPAAQEVSASGIYIERLWRSVKQEYVYENPCRIFDFYNNRRLHQILNYQCHATVYMKKRVA